MKRLNEWGRIHGAWTLIASFVGMLLGICVLHVDSVSPWIRWPAAVATMFATNYGILYLAWRFSANGYKRSH